MIENILSGFAMLADPSLWPWILGGTLLGLVLGLIPGTGSLMGMALFLPFTFKLEITEALPFIVALSAVGFTGGSITAVLIGVPGDASNIVTMLDGLPMTKKGQGARAIGAALTSSLVGGVIATFFACGMMFAIAPVVMAITSREMVFIILIGLSFICMLGTGEKLKSLISGCIGLLFSCVGLVSVTGEPRFTFDMAFLFEGLAIVPVTLGLFAIPPMIELAMKGGEGTISDIKIEKITMKDTLQGTYDVFRHKLLCLKSSIIGYFFGVLPGVGANAAVFLAYGQAKSSSSSPETFGKGNVEGVIAPESCNNAKESGSWLTTFALGVPGSATGAMGLAALLMLGITPGPSMITDHFSLTFAMLMIVAIANIIAFCICFPSAAQLAKITTMPSRILVPLVIVLILTGTYAYRGVFEDIYVLLVFGVLGLVLQHFKFNAGSMLLGYILGGMFENYLFISLQVDGPLFFMRPIPLCLIAVLVVFLSYPFIKSFIKRMTDPCA